MENKRGGKRPNEGRKSKNSIIKPISIPASYFEFVKKNNLSLSKLTQQKIEEIMYEKFSNEIGDKITITELRTERFKNINPVHDWRNYVDDVFKDNWKSLTIREKQIIYILCENKADAEVWD